MTHWSLVLAACHGSGDDVRSRQADVLERYYGAIYRYALRCLGDPDLAAEACQEFALRFVRGDFRHANPTRGRFRDYVKTSVVHLINEIRRNQERNRHLPLHEGDTRSVDFTPPDLGEDLFVSLWRKELLNRAWGEFEANGQSGPPYYAALRLKADSPALAAIDIAGALARAGHIRYSPEAVRQILHRARVMFADHLLDEVTRSALTDDPDRLSDELEALDLLIYCREALARRR